MRILLSNDDGIQSDGLAALHAALSELAEVWVVAPDREQSAASHAITLHRPLRIRERQPRWFAVDGTPTDCVYVALNHLMRDGLPDVVCSGINHGSNLANDVIYSGTVAAALEGALLGVSSLAISQVPRREGGWDFSAAARFSAAITRVVAEHPLPQKTLLNVNFPAGTPTGYAVTFLGKRNYGSLVAEKTDPRGRRYYWIGGAEERHDDLPGSDCNAVFDDGLVSVTPLKLDMTDKPLLATIADLSIPGYVKRSER